jgi:hypothetical protein
MAVVLLALAAAAQGGEFHYQPPPGWVELPTPYSPGSADTSMIPQRYLRDAASGTYQIVAIDPREIKRSWVGAMFNAVETAPATDRITAEDARQAAEDMAALTRSGGLEAKVVDADAITMNGVSTAVYTIDTDVPGDGPRRVRGYVIPGRRSAAVLSYSALRDDFKKHEAEFAASARATQGAYEFGGGGGAGWSWRQLFLAGLVGAGIALAFAAVIRFVARKRDPNAAEPVLATGGAATPAPKRATKYTWLCAACGNPVPMRLDECRCGGKKP